MFRTFLVPCILALAIGTGCAASAGDDAEGSAGALGTTPDGGVPATVFAQLFTEPHAVPDPECHSFTHLALGVKTAKLSAGRGGRCAALAFFEPEIRTFELKARVDGCGSSILTGKSVEDGVTREITITDNRKRVCEDVLAALFVVDEKVTKRGSAPKVTSLFSLDRPASAGTVADE